MEGSKKGSVLQTHNFLTNSKTYRTIGFILALGSVWYLFVASRMGTKIDLQEVTMYQPANTEDVGKKSMPVLSQRPGSSSDTGSKQRIKDTKKSQVNTDQHIVGIPNETDSKNRNQSRPNVANRIVKVIGIKPSDSHSREPKETLSDSPKQEPGVRNNTKTILSDKRIVLIMAYMRTGSTLTASVLQEYPGTFYAFEPVRSVHSTFKKSTAQNQTYTTFNYIHGVRRNYKLSEENEVKLQEINSWLTCDLESLSLQSLTDNFHKYYTKIMRSFYYCSRNPILSQKRPEQRFRAVKIQPQLRRYYDMSKRIDACIKSAIDRCQRAPLLALKFIRLRMEEVLPLLPMYPNMKIIHLVRDPRGILNSRLKVGAISRKAYQGHVNAHCTELNDDLKNSKKILETYKDRLKIVQYEDMAEHPRETARALAEFSGVQFLKPMQDYLQRQTHSSRDSCQYCTQRKNSSATAYKWRKQLDPEYATYIFEACKSSNEVLGYLPLSKVSLSNLLTPSRKIVDVNEKILKKDFS